MQEINEKTKSFGERQKVIQPITFMENKIEKDNGVVNTYFLSPYDISLLSYAESYDMAQNTYKNPREDFDIETYNRFITDTHNNADCTVGLGAKQYAIMNLRDLLTSSLLRFFNDINIELFGGPTREQNKFNLLYFVDLNDIITKFVQESLNCVEFIVSDDINIQKTYYYQMGSKVFIEFLTCIDTILRMYIYNVHHPINDSRFIALMKTMYKVDNADPVDYNEETRYTMLMSFYREGLERRLKFIHDGIFNIFYSVANMTDASVFPYGMKELGTFIGSNLLGDNKDKSNKLK